MSSMANESLRRSRDGGSKVAAATATAAPLRCFLGEIPKRLLSVQRQQEENDRRNQPHQRKYLHHQQHPPSSTSTFPSFRIMGTVVGVYEETGQLCLDDGTGLADIQASPEMIDQIHIQKGQLLECLVTAEEVVVQQQHSGSTTRTGPAMGHYAGGGGAAAGNSTTSTTTTTTALVAEQLVIVKDVHAESLRWFELSFKQHPSSQEHQYHLERGYPSRNYNSSDILQIIESECEHDDDENEDDQQTNNTNIHERKRGLSLEDIAECLSLDQTFVLGLIEELQISGHIYKNHHGLYVPL